MSTKPLIWAEPAIFDTRIVKIKHAVEAGQRSKEMELETFSTGN